MAAGTGRGIRRALRGLAALALLAAFAVLVWINGTPGEPAVCARLQRHATLAGERVNEDDREACEQEYARRRERLGVLEWGVLSRCIQRSRTISDAGGC